MPDRTIPFPRSAGTGSKRRLLVATISMLALLPGLGGCTPEATRADSSSTTQAGEWKPEKEVRDLIAALTPPSVEDTSDVVNAFHIRRKKTLERLRDAPPEVGRAVLETFHSKPGLVSEVRMGLLEVAAHTVPDETGQVLLGLVTEYGEDLGVREKACRLLGETQPALAVEALEPLVVEARHQKTYPPAESMLQAWVRGKRGLGQDPTDVLARIATDIYQEPTARRLAVRELGSEENPIARETLETLLVESTGDGLMRRQAAQAIRDSLPKEKACEIFLRTADREADMNFLAFLADMIDKNCQ